MGGQLRDAGVKAQSLPSRAPGSPSICSATGHTLRSDRDSVPFTDEETKAQKDKSPPRGTRHHALAPAQSGRAPCAGRASQSCARIAAGRTTRSAAAAVQAPGTLPEWKPANGGCRWQSAGPWSWPRLAGCHRKVDTPPPPPTWLLPEMKGTTQPTRMLEACIPPATSKDG